MLLQLPVVVVYTESSHSTPQRLEPLEWGKENAGERHQICALFSSSLLSNSHTLRWLDELSTALRFSFGIAVGDTFNGVVCIGYQVDGETSRTLRFGYPMGAGRNFDLQPCRFPLTSLWVIRSMGWFVSGTRWMEKRSVRFVSGILLEQAGTLIYNSAVFL